MLTVEVQVLQVGHFPQFGGEGFGAVVANVVICGDMVLGCGIAGAVNG